MEFLFELLGAVLEAILEAFFEDETIPKWIRYGVLTLLLGGFLALIVVALIAAGDWGLRIFMGILAAGLLAMMGYVFWKIFRYGIFQPAKKEDLPEILALYRSVIGIPGCTWSIAYPNEATLYEDFSTGNLFVLRQRGRIVGAGSIVSRNELDDLDCWQHKENAGEIARIVIRRDRQSRGYGKFLVDMLCQRLRKQDRKAVHILVARENHHALNLYRESKFHNVGACHRYDHDFYAYERKL